MLIVRKIKRLLGDERGFTLVELLVSFTLLLILMTAALAVISPSAKVFMKTIGAGRAQSVSTILMDRMTNELGAATEIIRVTNNQVEYVDSGGNEVLMEKILINKAQPNEIAILQLRYTKDEYDEQLWSFPLKVYMGNKIEELEFSTVADREDLIQIRLKLKNPQTDYEYERTRVVECYAVEGN